MNSEMTSTISSRDELFSQGAEARLFKTEYFGRPCIIKERFSKKYRLGVLDKHLNAQRMKSEVRSMMRCQMNGEVT